MEVYALMDRMKTSQNNSKSISRDNDGCGQENQMSRVYCSLYQCLWTGTPDVHCVFNFRNMERDVRSKDRRYVF